MARVVHFEIPSRDAKRTVKFYKDIFKWDITKWEGPEDYWSVVTGPKEEMGIDGGIEESSNPGYVCVISVDDIDSYSKKILDNGGVLFKPKRALKGDGWVADLAYFKDLEGNVFGIIQTDMKM